MHKNASDIFCLHPPEAREGGDQLFSIGGSPSIRLNRRRDMSTNVYPYGPQKNDTKTAYVPPEMMYPPPQQEMMGAPPPMDYPPEYYTEDPRNIPLDVPSIPIPVEEAPLILSPQSDRINGLDELPPQMPVPRTTLTRRNPLTGEGIELEVQKSGKRGLRGRKSVWTW